MADRAAFGPETTTDEVLEGIDLSGRRALVTGASGGLGAEAARALASAGAAVTITARDLAKGEGVAASIRDAHGADVEVRPLELSEPASVRQFAKDFLADHPELHILINNAAVMACPLTRTAEGWELQFATNHLGHFLLTNLLVPALRAGAPSRVVSVSSGGHTICGVDFGDIQFERRDYDPWLGYGQAKTANVLFAVELDRRLAESGVRAFSMHPGMIITDLGRHLDEQMVKDVMARAKERAEARKSVQAGAATEVYAATAPELEGKGGIYLQDCGIAPPLTPGGRGYADYAVDPEAAARLWSVSEALLGEHFEV
jgi:NAD(P)-dependent dehydrogenase (short-subunit alcohol dehydrogenase family)